MTIITVSFIAQRAKIYHLIPLEIPYKKFIKSNGSPPKFHREIDAQLWSVRLSKGIIYRFRVAAQAVWNKFLAAQLLRPATNLKQRKPDYPTTTVIMTTVHIP